MEKELWVKKIEQPNLKPLNQWRDELYGYWMVFSDTKQYNVRITIFKSSPAKSRKRIAKR